jgi:TonB family protein
VHASVEPPPDLPWLRLAAALAASLAVHAVLAAAVDTLPLGSRMGAFSPTRPDRAPLRAVLRGLEQMPSRAADAQAGAQAGARQQADSGGAASASPGVPAPHYYLARELDVRPGIARPVEPEYPERAAWRNLSGTVALRLYIGATGEVDKVDVVRAEPAGYFEGAAARAFGAARFTPGMKNGRAVRAQILVEVAFESPPPPSTPDASR